MAQRRRTTGVRKGPRTKASLAKPRKRRVRVVRSRPTRAKKPVRPLPPAEMFSERLFVSSLERSLRDNRQVWEALAKR